MRAVAIINPTAGSGRAGRLWPDAAKVLKAAWPKLVVHETRETGHARGLAAEAAAAGAERLIICGGDGTIGEVVDGLLSARGPLPAIGIVPAGTGADFVRTIGRASSSAEAAALIVSGNPMRIDAGRVTYTREQGDLGVRHFINAASLGVSGPTALAVNARKRKGGGKAAFLAATVAELIRYRFQDVRIAVDGAAPIETRIALVAIANGRSFGGGMRIAPDAAPDDGLFDVVVVRAASKRRLLFQLRRLYSGTHLGLAEVTILKGRRVTVEPAAIGDACPILVEADGESSGQCPAIFEVLPGALELVR